ncbi:unnamed protein product, partial [Bubo scandiacus]
PHSPERLLTVHAADLGLLSSWTRFGCEGEPDLGMRMRCYQSTSEEETGKDGFGVPVSVVWV